MIKFLTLTILLSSSHSLWAIEDVLSGLNSINKFDMDCSQMSNDELAKECAHQVCGEPAKKSIKVSAKDASKYLSDPDNKKLNELESQLRSYYQGRLDEINSLVSEFNKRKNSSDFSNFFQWKSHDWEPILDYFWAEMPLDVDYAHPLNSRKPKLIGAQNHPHKAVFDELLSHFDLQNDPLRSLNFGLITTEEFKTLVQKKVSEYEMLLRKQNQESKFNFNQFNFQLSTGVQDHQSLIKHYQSLISDAELNGIQLIPNHCKEQCQKSTQTFIKQFDPSKLKKDLENSLNSLSVEDRISTCKANFLSAHMTNRKKDEFAKLLPEIKKGFNDNIFSQFSKESADKLRKYLDEEINFFYEDPFRTKFEDFSNSLKLTKSSYTNVSNNELLKRTFTLLNENEDSLFQCGSTRSLILVWDAFAPKEYINSNPQFRPQGLIPGRDNISISPYSCEHHGEGKGIIAHELGHALSAVMSRGEISKSSSRSYLKIRRCVTSKWENNPKTQLTFHKGDKFYTEEDTADVISYMAIKDPASFYSCALIRPDESEYVDLGTSPSLLDNHTPGMIRLLREIQYKAPQKIPSACAEMVKRHPDKVGKSCLPN